MSAQEATQQLHPEGGETPKIRSGAPKRKAAESKGPRPSAGQKMMATAGSIIALANSKMVTLVEQFKSAAKSLIETEKERALRLADLVEIIAAIQIANKHLEKGRNDKSYVTADMLAEWGAEVGLFHTRKDGNIPDRTAVTRYMAMARWSALFELAGDEERAALANGVKINGEVFHFATDALRRSGAPFTVVYDTFAELVAARKDRNQRQKRSGKYAPLPEDTDAASEVAVDRVRLTMQDPNSTKRKPVVLHVTPGHEGEESSEARDAAVALIESICQKWSGMLNEKDCATFKKRITAAADKMAPLKAEKAEKKAEKQAQAS